MNQLVAMLQENNGVMSSLDLSKMLVPEFKKDGTKNEYQHKDFMVKAKKVLGEEGMGKFSHTYTSPQNGMVYKCLQLPKREACLMAMSYSYELQAKVYDAYAAYEESLKAIASGSVTNPAKLAMEVLQKQHQVTLAQSDAAIEIAEADLLEARNRKELAQAKHFIELANIQGKSFDVNQLAVGITLTPEQKDILQGLQQSYGSQSSVFRKNAPSASMQILLDENNIKMRTKEVNVILRQIGYMTGSLVNEHEAGYFGKNDPTGSKLYPHWYKDSFLKLMELVYEQMAKNELKNEDE